MRIKSENWPIKVKYVKLGRQKAWGQAYKESNLIEIEKRARGKLRMRSLLYEGLHCCCPEYKEYRIRKIEKLLSDMLWEQGYRRVKRKIPKSGIVR